LLSRDFISSLFWIACGGLITLGSLRLPLGGPQNPGPGFLPFLVGVLMSILSVALLIRSFRFQREKKTEPTAAPSRRFKLVATTGGLFLFAFAFPYLGFLITTIPLMIFLPRVIGKLSWKVSLTIGFLTSVAMYALFKIWLKVQFPVGPWGF
jgi:putative tricarboxylic transport membrane protein